MHASQSIDALWRGFCGDKRDRGAKAKEPGRPHKEDER